MWSVFHQLHIFEGLGELPQRPALHERPLAEAVIVPPEAALQYPAAEAAPLPLMPEDQLREQVRLTDQMVINAAMAEQAAKAAQEAEQRAAVAQRKADRAQKKAQKAAQPKRPRGRPKGVSPQTAGVRLLPPLAPSLVVVVE